MAFKFNAEVRTAQGKGKSHRLASQWSNSCNRLWWQRRAVCSIILNHDELNNAQAHVIFLF